jgi:hypothetical protein
MQSVEAFFRICPEIGIRYQTRLHPRVSHMRCVPSTGLHASTVEDAPVLHRHHIGWQSWKCLYRVGLQWFYAYLTEFSLDGECRGSGEKSCDNCELHGDGIRLQTLTLESMDVESGKIGGFRRPTRHGIREAPNQPTCKLVFQVASLQVFYVNGNAHEGSLRKARFRRCQEPRRYAFNLVSGVGFVSWSDTTKYLAGAQDYYR